MTCFIHTADWQLGKPFSRVDDPDGQALLRQERLSAIDRIGKVARERQASFIVVAGDVFDSHLPPPRLISTALERIGQLPVPVYIIPGNHDYGGPGSLWLSDHMRREQQALAPNLTVLLHAEPIERDNAILLPCPLQHKKVATDPTAWLHALDFAALDERPRIVLAHGSTVNFQAEVDTEDEPGQTNFINLERLQPQLAEMDYIALGDWHGFVQAGEKAWYAGSHETDRFPKTDQLPGHVALVKVSRGGAPQVEAVPTGAVRWIEHSETFVASTGPDQLSASLERLRGDTGSKLMLKLHLDGHLSLEGQTALQTILSTWSARTIHLRVDSQVALQPSDDELAALTTRSDDPLISGVAQSLTDALATEGEDAEVAEIAAIALTLLHHHVRQLEATA